MILPAPIILSIIGFIFPHWPRHQLYVLRSFLRSPRAVFSSLTMARHEILTVGSLASTNVGDVLRQESRRIWVYYGDSDKWVPDRMAETVYKILREAGGAKTRQEVAAEKGRGRFQGGTRRKWLEGVCGEVVFGAGIPHDFCISEYPEPWCRLYFDVRYLSPAGGRSRRGPFTKGRRGVLRFCWMLCIRCH